MNAIHVVSETAGSAVGGAARRREQIVALLLRVPDKYRRAVLFGFEMNLPFGAVVGLRWRDLRQLKLTPGATLLVEHIPRHIKLSYVFWAWLSNGAAAPLFGMEEAFSAAADGARYDDVQRSYKALASETREFVRSLLVDVGLR